MLMFQKTGVESVDMECLSRGEGDSSAQAQGSAGLHSHSELEVPMIPSQTDAPARAAVPCVQGTSSNRSSSHLIQIFTEEYGRREPFNFLSPLHFYVIRPYIQSDSPYSLLHKCYGLLRRLFLPDRQPPPTNITQERDQAVQAHF